MRALFLIVLYAGLCSASSGSNQENIETLMDNVLVLRVPYSLSTSVYVPLSCGEAYQNQPVFWKKNGEEIEPALQGNQVKVLVEEMNGGNYTCHLGPDGEYLNHTVILIQLDPDNRTVILEEFPGEGHIYCSAPNYNGSFHCTWRRSATRSNAAVLLVKAERNSEKIPCELDSDGSGILCKDTNCPYKEEQHRVSITIYIHSYSRLEAYTRTFYLREIVRPGKLPNLIITDGKVFSWNYPESWEMPCTYFGLQYQVKVVQKGFPCHSKKEIMSETIEKMTYEVKIKPNKYVFCVRAQDKYTNGPFSHWSHCIVDKHTEVC
ncbi:interleukin-12 subunit beta isoform X2 [Etheostoma spectabile]|uniref:interleukin-12 subunit beta isoform X2 n=1 Tax=Etheostoma spectabile TaxID=54343 RepID=UPI0013AFC23E|nr:interleukin-12 subunit beta-like isoform X2 [Etheostoma spectabile]